MNTQLPLIVGQEPLGEGEATLMACLTGRSMVFDDKPLKSTLLQETDKYMRIHLRIQWLYRKTSISNKE